MKPNRGTQKRGNKKTFKKREKRVKRKKKRKKKKKGEKGCYSKYITYRSVCTFVNIWPKFDPSSLIVTESLLSVCSKLEPRSLMHCYRELALCVLMLFIFEPRASMALLQVLALCAKKV
jgi:hypothetical protein